MTIDNSKYVVGFISEKDDGDSFNYTELLDRTKQKGNNGHRRIKTFYHRSREEFDAQLPEMIRLCETLKVRAYTRLAKRSWKKVGAEFTRLVVQSALTENWIGMKAAYSRACGIVTPDTKLWLVDIDEKNEENEQLASSLQSHGILIMRIPSRQGEHLICRPFDARGFMQVWPGLTIHKDNPTNLYIPDGAA